MIERDVVAVAALSLLLAVAVLFVRGSLTDFCCGTPIAVACIVLLLRGSR